MWMIYPSWLFSHMQFIAISLMTAHVIKYEIVDWKLKVPTGETMGARIKENPSCRHPLSASSEYKENTGHQCSTRDVWNVYHEENWSRRKITKKITLIERNLPRTETLTRSFKSFSSLFHVPVVKRSGVSLLTKAVWSGRNIRNEHRNSLVVIMR